MEEGAAQIADLLNREGVSADHVTMSTDAFGSQPKFNEIGECIGLTYASPKYLHQTVQSLVSRGLPLEEVLKMVTSTPADLLAKKGVKGCVAEGADADILVLGEELAIESLFMRGKTAVLNGKVLMKGRFE
jgi:beta-aspartyl-dipeptidase (metallo-type)